MATAGPDFVVDGLIDNPLIRLGFGPGPKKGQPEIRLPHFELAPIS
jgi:hypothetical protein